MPIFPCFLHVFWAVPLNFKNEEEGQNEAEGHRAFFCRFCSTSKALSRCIKNEAEGHRAFFWIVFVAHSKAVPRCIKTGLGQAQSARAGERHKLVGHQMKEQVRHRAVQALEGEPGKVARAGADTTQRHLGHALGGKAGNEAVAQVAHAADVDVAHRVVVSTRKDGEEVEVLRGSLHGVVRVLQAAQLHLRLQEAVLLPGRADGRPAPGWPKVDLGARVVVPKGHKRAHEFREGARHGDVVLRHAVRDAGLLRVHRGVAEHQRPS